MEKLRMYNRWWEASRTRNPLISGRAHITEVMFDPFIDDDELSETYGQKKVTVFLIDWVECVDTVKENSAWEKRVYWDGTIDKIETLSASEANKVWLACKKEKYSTQKTPKELIGAKVTKIGNV